LIKVGGTENERCRGKVMEVLMIGDFTPNQMDIIWGTSQVQGSLALTAMDTGTWPLDLGEEVLFCFLKQWRWINEGLGGMGVPLRF
jgi:hypothetical protein